MSEPLKDLGRLACDSRDHRVLARIAADRGITLHELLREVIGDYVRRTIHHAKVVLGQDDDNGSTADHHGARAGDDGSSRSRPEPRGAKR